MTPALALFTVTLGQALPKKRTLMLAILQLAPAATYLLSTSNRTEEFALEAVVQVGSGVFFALVLPVVSIVIATGALGSERRDQTLSFIALRPIPRSVIAASKTLAALVGAFAINTIGAVALAGAHAFRFGDTQLFLGLVLGALVATTAYVAIYVPFGFLTDRAVIIGMAYLLVFENGVANALPALASLSPWRLGVATFGAISPDAAIYAANLVGTLEFNAVQTSLTALVILLVGIGTTTVLLRTKDLA